jgi:hypothetical protein
VCGCTTTTPIPDTPVIAGSEAVRILKEAQQVEVRECTAVGEISATDGLIGAGRKNFDGTEERATTLLRNQAFAMHADTVLILVDLRSYDTAYVGRSRNWERKHIIGIEVYLSGTAYRCS